MQNQIRIIKRAPNLKVLYTQNGDEGRNINFTKQEPPDSEEEACMQEEEHYFENHTANQSSHLGKRVYLLEAEEEDNEEDVDPNKKRLKVSGQLNKEQEADLVEWFAANPMYYDQGHRKFKSRAQKELMMEEKARELGLTAVQISTWFKSMRTIYGKLKKRLNSGQQGKVLTDLTARQQWTYNSFQFLESHMTVRTETSYPSKVQNVPQDDDVEEYYGEEEVTTYTIPSHQIHSQPRRAKTSKTPAKQNTDQSYSHRQNQSEHRGRGGGGTVTNRPDNKNREAFCQWMGLEVSILSEDLWTSFLTDAFNLVMKYTQQQMTQGSSAMPRISEIHSYANQTQGERPISVFPTSVVQTSGTQVTHSHTPEVVMISNAETVIQDIPM